MRVRISLPAQWDFSTTLTVRVGDLNYGNHLGNDRVVSFIHETRVRWLASNGWSEMDVEGAAVIQTDTSVQYKSQGFLGDVIEVKLAIVEVHRRGFELAYRMERPADKTEIARATTNLLFFDYGSQQISNTPDKFAEMFDRTKDLTSN